MGSLAGVAEARRRRRRLPLPKMAAINVPAHFVSLPGALLLLLLFLL